jgi:predicted metalloprotease with PDZ domain
MAPTHVHLHGAIRHGWVAPLVSALFAGAPLAAGATRPAGAEPVRYTFELVDPLTPVVAIHLECRGDADGTSDFTLNEGWAGLVDCGRDLELVEARAGDEPLELERPASHTFRVRHAPSAELALVFELDPSEHRKSPMPPEYYLPILEAGLLHVLGAQALPAPTHLDFAAERPIALAWRGFAEAGWRTATSWGSEPELALTRSLDAFRHALFLAGELRLSTHDVHGHPLAIALHGHWSFTDDEFRALATRVVALGREFFADFEQPYFLISLIPVGAGAQGTTSLGGTALTNSFALFLTPEVGLAPQPGRGGVAWLLAHELFHQWNGQVIGLEQPEALAYWFSEGFTDFYTRRLLFRGGLASATEHLESWNQKLRSFASNPERHAPATRVAEAFWQSAAVGDLPYQRGDLIALYVDHAIRTRTQGERSLDDLMRTLVARSRAGAGPYSSAELCAAIAELAGEEVGATALRWALEGVEPELAPDAVGPEWVLEPADIPSFDTGFDHEASLASGTITGVVAGGCAERAGLRDGMRFGGWVVNHGATDVPLEVTVLDAGARRTLRYLPHGAPLRGHHLRARL